MLDYHRADHTMRFFISSSVVQFPPMAFDFYATPLFFILLWQTEGKHNTIIWKHLAIMVSMASSKHCLVLSIHLFCFVSFHFISFHFILFRFDRYKKCSTAQLYNSVSISFTCRNNAMVVLSRIPSCGLDLVRNLVLVLFIPWNLDSAVVTKFMLTSSLSWSREKSTQNTCHAG